jgi:hypothetical protein
MKLLSHPAVTALGATTIIFMVWLAPLASTLHEGVFHMPGSLTVIVAPLLIAFAAVWIFWWLLLALSRRSELANTLVWAVLIVVLIREMIEAWDVLKPTDKLWEEVKPLSRLTNVSYVIVALAILVAMPLLNRKRPGIVIGTKKLVMVILAFVALSGTITLAKVVSYAWLARNLNTPRPLRQPAATLTPPSKHPRVVWLLMDELSYRQLYEHRYFDLQMPAFDRLAQESTVFTNVRPEGRLTEYVVPSLISGIPGTDDKAPASGDSLSLLNAKTKQWQVVDPRQTVFQDALDAGYTPAVAGWWIPYCRLFPAVLDHCFWTATTDSIADMNSTKSVGWNLKELAYRAFRQRMELLHLAHKGGVPESTGNQDVIYHKLVSVGDTYFNDPSIDFIYLHMNVPHPGGFYQRHTGKFLRDYATYIDNLALADIYLAHIRSLLEANGTWDNTTLVIMGDHSWRTNFIWAKTEGWQPEEQRASDGGKFDDRPGYIVKLAGQTTPARVDIPFQAIRSRALFNALFKGQITTPQQLAEWVK